MLPIKALLLISIALTVKAGNDHHYCGHTWKTEKFYGNKHSTTTIRPSHVKVKGFSRSDVVVKMGDAIHLSKGYRTGTFEKSSILVSSSGFCTEAGDMLYSADFNGDMHYDLLCHKANGGKFQVKYRTASGYSATQAYGGLFVCPVGSRAFIGDLDGNKVSDIACLEPVSDVTTIYLGQSCQKYFKPHPKPEYHPQVHPAVAYPAPHPHVVHPAPHPAAYPAPHHAVYPAPHPAAYQVPHPAVVHPAPHQAVVYPAPHPAAYPAPRPAMAYPAPAPHYQAPVPHYQAPAPLPAVVYPAPRVPAVTYQMQRPVMGYPVKRPIRPVMGYPAVHPAIGYPSRQAMAYPAQYPGMHLGRYKRQTLGAAYMSHGSYHTQCSANLPATKVMPAGSFTGCIADATIFLTDSNGDKKDDVVCRRADNSITFWLSKGNVGSAMFGGRIDTTAMCDAASVLKAADVDGDGDMDLLCIPQMGHIGVSYFSSGTYHDFVYSSNNCPYHCNHPHNDASFIVGDFNEDGKDDLMCRYSKDDNGNPSEMSKTEIIFAQKN